MGNYWNGNPSICHVPFKGQVHPNKKWILNNREKSNKHTTENFIKIGCQIRKLWIFKVSLIFHKTVICTSQWYANERVGDVTHSLFLLYFIVWILQYFNFCRFNNKEVLHWIIIGCNNGDPIYSIRNKTLFHMIIRKKLRYFIFHIMKYKRNSEWMTSSVPSFAYRPGCAYNCFVKLSETC